MDIPSPLLPHHRLDHHRSCQKILFTQFPFSTRNNRVNIDWFLFQAAMSQKARSSRCPPPPVQGINHHQKKPCCREPIFWDRLSDLENSTTFDHFPIPPKKEPVRVAEEYLIKLGSWTLMHICLVWENRTFSNCVCFGAAAVSFVRIATASLNWSSLNLAPAPQIF